VTKKTTKKENNPKDKKNQEVLLRSDCSKEFVGSVCTSLWMKVVYKK